MGTINKIVLIISLIMASGCTLFEIQAPLDVDVNVGPNACDFIDSFESLPNSSWVPTDYTGCNGYALSSSGDCLDNCSSTLDCDMEYYCVHEVNECHPRLISGECTMSDECVSGICMCDVCIDEEALVDFIGSAAIEGLSP